MENEAATEGSAFADRGILGSRALLVTAGVQSFPHWQDVFVGETTPCALLPDGVSAQVFLTAAQASTIADVLEQRALAADAVLPRYVRLLGFVDALLASSSPFAHSVLIFCSPVVWCLTVGRWRFQASSQASPFWSILKSRCGREMNFPRL